MVGDDCRRRHPPLAGECGEDHISCLPDELLHAILLRLDSLPDAARTSVLSRRWRRVWTSLPQLFLSPEDEGPLVASSLPDIVDAILAAYAAPTIEHLSICVPATLPAQRIAPWLRFASEHVVGTISLYFSFIEMTELEIPACGTATTIELSLSYSRKLRCTGVFPVLTCLDISFACMDGRELSDLVSMRCPRLKKLGLILKVAADSDVSIHSDSLHSLRLGIKNARRLEVIAPRLEELSIWSLENYETLISAPKLATIIWTANVYNPHRHRFTHVCRRLRLLELRIQPTMTQLMKQFDEVDELRLEISIPLGTAGYKSFLNVTNWLSKCETLKISLWWNRHGLVPAILHLLKCCNSTKKLSINLAANYFVPPLRYSCPLDCPCRLAEGCSIALFSLEEVEIENFFGSHEEMEFMEQLSQCKAPVLKKLGIIGKTGPDSPLTKEVREKVRCLCRPNLNVEFYRESVIVGGAPVRLD